MSKSAERFGPVAFAILLLFGTTAGHGTTTVTLAIIATVCVIGAVLFIRHSIKKEAADD